MKKLIKENIALKLLSVFIALGLWLIVVNVSKPEMSSSRIVKLDVHNSGVFESEHKTWEIDGKDTINISYNVRMDQRNKISADDFNAYIDLKDYSITGSVPVHVEVLNEKDSIIGNVSWKPSVVHINIEDNQEKQFTIKHTIKGHPANGYILSSILVSPETIFLTGPESEIGKISDVGIDIPIDACNKNEDGKAEIKYLDANGNEIKVEGVSASQDQVAFTATINKKKDVKIFSRVSGSPEDGYRYKDTVISPDTISLSGPEAVMDDMDLLLLDPPIDINDANKDIVKTYNVESFLPEGIKLAEPEGRVEVVVKIEKIPGLDNEDSDSENKKSNTGEIEN